MLFKWWNVWFFFDDNSDEGSSYNNFYGIEENDKSNSITFGDYKEISYEKENINEDEKLMLIDLIQKEHYLIKLLIIKQL